MNLNQLTDEELMVMYQNGDELAFQQLYLRHSGRILGYIRSKISDSELAGDIFQEVFIKVHRSKRLYKPSFEVLPWLFTITRNSVIDGLRKNKRNQLNTDQNVEELAAPKVEETIEMGQLTPALSQLPENQRQAIQMRYVDEKTFDEIARQLNTSSENVRQLVSRGVKTLKNLFGEEKKNEK